MVKEEFRRRRDDSEGQEGDGEEDNGDKEV